MLGIASTSSVGGFFDGVKSVPVEKRRITMVGSPSSAPEDAVATADFSEIPGLPTADTAASAGDHGKAACEEMKESTELALGCNTDNGGFGNQYVQMPPRLPEDREKKEKGMLLRLDSGYFNDDRSHWDLNSPMDSWEKQPGVLDADSVPVSTGKVPAGTSCKKSAESLDGIQVHTLDVEAKSKVRKAEEDMLSKGFQADPRAHGLDSSEGLASEDNGEVDTYLGLRPDTLLDSPRAAGEKPMKRARVSKIDERLEESVAERGLKLCIAPFEGSRYSANDVSTQTEDGKHRGGKLSDDNSEAGRPLQSDKRPGRVVFGSEVYASDNIEYYPALKYDGELVNDKLDAVDGNCAKENPSGPLTDDAGVECPVFSTTKHEHVIETMVEDGIEVDGAVTVKDSNRTRELAAKSEDGLDKQTTDYATEAAYAGDYKQHGDGGEPVSDTVKGLVGQTGGEFQDEDGEHKETEPSNWIEEDAHREMEVEHVDNGDSDYRDVDDLGINSGEREESVECMGTKDVKHERNWDGGQQSEMKFKNYDTCHD